MKITKLVHSCLLVEKDGKKALVDPGSFSWSSGIITEQSILSGIDYVVLTHTHADHFDHTFANVVHELSPNAVWYSVPEVVATLRSLGIRAYDKSELSDVQLIKSEHADLDPWNTQPEHTSFMLFSELFVSGDCQTHQSIHGARILAGPINGGPWGAVVGELKMIQALKARPEVFVPLHDWHWSDEARAAMYAQLPTVMEKLGVRFVPVINGQSFEV